MGKQEDMHLYHELAGPFKTYPWYNRLISGHHNVIERQQIAEKEADPPDNQPVPFTTDSAVAKLHHPTTPQKKHHATNAAYPNAPTSSPFPTLTPPSQAILIEPSPRAKKLAIDAGFGNYSFLNTLADADRRMWSTFLGERRIADNTLRSIASLYSEPRSPGFTRKLVEKVAEKYPMCQEAVKSGSWGISA